MRSGRLIAVAAALVTAGCGSTVANVPGAGSANELAAPTPGASGVGPGGTPLAPGATPGVTGSVGPGAGPGSLSTGGPGPTGTGQVPTVSGGSGNGPGITPTAIYVGEDWDPQVGTADAAIGGAQGNPGDAQSETDAMIKWINQNGGIAHRQVIPVWHQISVKDKASTSAEQTCQAWTSDKKVFVFDGGNFRGAGTAMDECAWRHGGIELVPSVITMETTPIESQYPTTFDLNALPNDKAMGYTINGLANLGYFTRLAHIGIVTWDDPYYHYGIDHVALPALAALGYHNVPVRYIASPESYGDLGATSAATSTAVLAYRNTVDHVILFDGTSGIAGGGILTLEWMQQAHSQHYHPTYGLNSGSGFNALGGNLPADELPKSMGVGWEPTLEQTSTDFEAMHKPEQAKLCLQIMDSAGLRASTANSQAIQLGICDYFFILKQALDGIQGPINQATAVAAFNAIGTRHQSLVNFAARVDAQHHDLPYLVRNMTYQSGCSCFRYVGPVYNPGN